MFVKPIEKASQINFLASEHFQAFSHVVTSASVTAVNGKKILPAGSILPANDATAKGITLWDVDVTNGDNVVSLIVEGYILKDRLPVVPAAAAITALKEIKFF